MPNLRFLTNHALVLSHIARWPRMTARELAQSIGITERATRRIIDDLLENEYVTKKREGRRNRYQVNPDHSISPPGFEETAVRVIFEMLGWIKRGRPRKNS
jgi:DNA-binding transcriptional ArsR family regulator